eukprot:m51a1_g6172 hypothetical protein (274) ;mRNA; f:8494-9513
MLSTRTERLFAALQGPVLSVASAVVHSRAPFAVELLLPARWRHVRADALPDSPPLSCVTCGGVVAITGVRRVEERLPPGGDVEGFAAAVRSVCSSSRLHLRAPTVVLAVNVAGTVVFSEPFAVFARRPGRQRKSRPAAAEEPAADSGACRTVMAMHPTGLTASLNAIPASMLPPRMLVVVEVVQPLSLADPPPDAWKMVPGLGSELKQRVPGFLMQKVTASREVVVFVRAYRTVEDVRKAADICHKYALNVITNALNMDMRGTAQLLAKHTNW